MIESHHLYAVEDLDDLNQKAGWQAEYRLLHAGHFHAQFCFGRSSGFDLTKEFLTGNLEVVAAGENGVVSLLICRPSVGELKFNGMAMGSGDLYVLMPGSEIRAHVKSNTVVDTIRIPLLRVAEIATAFDLDRQGVFSGPSRKLKVPREVLEGFALGLDAVLFGDSTERAGADARLNRAAEGFVRALLGSGTSPFCIKQMPRIGSRQQFQNALEFIDARLAEQTTVAEICTQAEIGMRTLERHFAQEMGVTPAAYIAARRLNAARRSLAAADPEDSTVTQIAAMHGITHLGRFSGNYRRFFGEPPSDTLKRWR